MPDLDQIFHDLSDPVEDVNEYRPGGYYPIQLGQSLRNGRYLILRKTRLWILFDRMASKRSDVGPSLPQLPSWLTPVS
jgi:hypothetical protein